MDLVGRSAQIVALRAQVARVAPLDTPVLITGEPGTGKDLVAAAIHKAGPRAGRRLLAFDVAGLPESLFDAEGLDHARGLLEKAQGSTVLFRHSQPWPCQVPPVLLHLLHERLYVRAGAAEPVAVDARVIVSTTTDLEALLEDERVDSIHVPPLRDRMDDIPLLARYFLDRSAREYRKEIAGFVPAALAILARHEWPGNVLELMNVIERAVLFSTNKRIVPDDVAYLLQGR